MAFAESCRGLSDDALVSRIDEVVACDRRDTAQLIALIAEFDLRRLYLAQGFPSLYEYCVGYLHLTEHEAYSRIQAARLSRRFPAVLALIEAGDVSLTAVILLGPHLTESNHRQLLDEAKHRRKPEIEEMVARLKPQPPVKPIVRKVVEAPSVPMTLQTPLAAAADDASASSAVAAPSRAVVKPLAPELYKVQFTVSGETRAKLRAVQDLLRHSVPNGDIGVVFDRALSALLADLEKRKLALVPRPRAAGAKAGGRKAGGRSRHIPAEVRREVWRRDRGRCAFVGTEGRCRERGCLELHHVKPYAAGGQSTVENIELRCRAQNGHEADVYFGSGRGP